MTQQLRALVALLEDPGSSPSTNYSVSEDLMPSSGLRLYQQLTWYTDVYANEILTHLKQ